MSVPFVHLHNHTDRSLLDATLKIDEMAKAAAEMGFKAIAKTDHGNLFGAVKFHDACRDAGVVPILGCEFYVAPGSRHDRGETIRPGDVRGSIRGFHLTVLAENMDGYRNLVALATRAFTEGFYYHPRIDLELLSSHAKGLLCLSGCLSAEVPRRALGGDESGARKAAARYREIFGRENYFLEIQDHGLPEDRRLLPFLRDLAGDEKIPLVATNDVHYLRPEDAVSHDLFLCVGTRKSLDDPNRKKYGAETFFLKSYEEMRETFPHDDAALRRTLEIADRCHVDLSFKGFLLPPFEIPTSESADAHLARLANEGLRARLGKSLSENPPEDYAWRLTEELTVIRALGFATYFLIVADFIAWAKGKGIPVGPGRGSAVGSLVSYAIGITEIDPLPHGLLFERFLNAGRKAMPDIDCDFCEARRTEVLDYLKVRYGEANVAQIATFQTLKARRTIRDVGKVLGVSQENLNRIAALIPPGETDLAEAVRISSELAKEAKASPDLFRYSERLVGLKRDPSRHASGVVLSGEGFDTLVPRFTDKNGNLAAQYDMDEIQRLGLIKFDVLGLKTLTMIRKTLDRCAAVGTPVVFGRDFSDEATFRLLASGETLGVFQCDSEGMRDCVRRIAPRNLGEVSLAIAFFRPGAMSHFDEFLARRKGERTVPMHPMIAEVLGDSYGLPIYQEHVLLAARRLADFTPEEADDLRAAMSKKKDTLREYRRRFVDAAVAKGIPRREAEELMNSFEQFSRYGFNKSHSIAYAVLAYQTAYLKAHHPAEFLAALLSSEMEKHRDKLALYLGEARRLGLSILPPSVERSERDFTTEGEKGIRFGLGAVKNLGTKVIDAILAARRDGPFRDLGDFLSRLAAEAPDDDASLANRKTLECLVASGSLDGFGFSRRALMTDLDLLLSYLVEEIRARASGQASLFGDRLPPPSVRRLPESPLAQVLLEERAVLESYVSAHPLETVAASLPAETLRRIGPLVVRGGEEEPGSAGMDPTVPSEALLRGVIVSVETRTDRNQETYARVRIEDFSGVAEVLVFATLYRETRDLWVGGRLVEARVEVQWDEGLSLVARRAKALEPGAREKKEEARRDPSRVGAGSAARRSERATGGGLSSGLHIRLDGNEERLEEIRDRLAASPGETPVYLHLREGENDRVFLLDAGADPDTMLVEVLGEILGANAVRMVS